MINENKSKSQLIEKLFVLQQQYTELQAEISKLKQANNEREYLLETEHEKVTLAEALLQAGSAMSRTLDYDKTLDHILEQIGRVVPHDGTSIMLVEDEEKVLFFRWRGKTGFDTEKLTEPVVYNISDFYTLSQMKETGLPMVIPNVNKDKTWLFRPSRPEWNWIKSYAGSPIHYRGKLIAFLNVNSRNPNFFSQKDGEHLQAFANQSAIALENARLYRVAQEEITKHENTENRLRDSEAKNRALLNSIPDLIFRLNKKGTVLDYKPAKGEYMSSSLDEFAGKNITEILPSNLSRKSMEAVNLALQTNDTQIFEYKMSVGYGTTLDFEARVVISNINEALVIVRNITERKRAETMLKEREKKFRTIAEASPIPVVVTRLSDGIILYANPPLGHTFGLPAQGLAGRHISELYVKPADFEWIVKLIKREGTTRNREVRLKKNTGTRFWAAVSINPITFNGEPALFSSIYDITDRKLAEKLLKDYNNELERNVSERTKALAEKNSLLEHEIEEHKRTEQKLQIAKEVAEQARVEADIANQAKNRFLANMSHELRTPLNGILGYTQILRKEKNLTAKQKKGINVIQRSGDHLLTLINDILDMSKVEAGKLKLTLTNFHLLKMLKNIADIFHIRTEQKNISFLYEVISDLPDGVHGDETKLRQVLTNLLGNAVKFTNTGSVMLKVGFNSNEDKIRFVIEDTGIGIASEALEEIFTPFQQATGMVEGTGLGLTVSRKLIEMMGGRLKVKSTEGEGSTFWFELDLPRVEDLTAVIDIEEKPITGFKGNPHKILVVDDKWENRSVLVNMLSPLGFELSEAVDGQDGLDKAIKGRPDVILLDLIMPVMNGFEVMRRIRDMQMGQNMVIITVSANDDDHHAQIHQEELALNSDDTISKPFQLQTLLGLLQTHLKLEWIYEDEEPETNGANADTAPLIVPSQIEIATLFDLAKQGDIGGIVERADSLEQIDNQFVPFTTQLRDLAKGFKLKEIREFVQQYME